MTSNLRFPTRLHQETAESIRDYFMAVTCVDTVLVVNSCARGLAAPESDLDIAVLTRPGTAPAETVDVESAWRSYSRSRPIFSRYRQLNQFAHLHLDIINGNYQPANLEKGEPVDHFELAIGNQLCYSVPMDNAGPYFKELQGKWLPYYNEELRLQRSAMSQKACAYDLDHIPLLVERGLYFHASHILHKAFEEYLQALFIANKVYPIAYNKWIREQVVGMLDMPDLYQKLPPILSISNIESNETIEKADMLRQLLADIKDRGITKT